MGASTDSVLVIQAEGLATGTFSVFLLTGSSSCCA